MEFTNILTGWMEGQQAAMSDTTLKKYIGHNYSHHVFFSLRTWYRRYQYRLTGRIDGGKDKRTGVQVRK